MNILYILLLFLCNIVVASETQLFVQCSDGSFFIKQEELEALPGLNIGSSQVKEPQFPRYYVQNNKYVESYWVPTMAYMKELTDFSVFDYRKMKTQFPPKTFAELCVMYHDYAYLCIDDRLGIEQSLIKQFYREHNVKREHWAFMIQYFSSIRKSNPFFDFTKTESPTRDRMIAYWLSKMNQYKEKYIFCSHENGTDFYILNDDLYKQLDNIIKKYYRFFYAEFDAFKRKICNGVLDLSDFELTDDILYYESGEGLNGNFFDYVLNAYPVNFKVKYIILDNNKINRLPLEIFIKSFPNIQTISIKGCPINQKPSKNDFTIFNYKRSDYLIKIPPNTLICEGMRQYYNRDTLMWNGRDSLVEGYSYENDNKPLTVITDNDFVLKSYNNVDCAKLILKKEKNQPDKIMTQEEHQNDKETLISNVPVNPTLKIEPKKSDELSKKKSNNNISYYNKNIFLYVISFTGFNVLLCWITWRNFMSKNVLSFRRFMHTVFLYKYIFCKMV